MNESTFDSKIHDSLTYGRFIQIKRTYKLCNNYKCPKRGNPGYNPAYKYDLIFKCLVFNFNNLTKKADLDLCGYKTTSSHNGYSETGSGLCKRMGQMKPGITRVIQTVMLFDINIIRPRAYLHRHKHHTNKSSWSSGHNELR